MKIVMVDNLLFFSFYLFSANCIYVDKGDPYSLGKLNVTSSTVTEKGDGSPMHTTRKLKRLYLTLS